MIFVCFREYSGLGHAFNRNMKIMSIHECNWSGSLVQRCHGQGKKSGKRKIFQVREKSGNYIFSQVNLEKCKKSGKSQGISKFS